MTSAVAKLDTLLDQLNAAAELNNWDALTDLDNTLREVVATFAPTAPANELTHMLSSLERAKQTYTHVLHLCQRRQNELRKESLNLERGRKATHNYLTGQNSLHYGNS